MRLHLLCAYFFPAIIKRLPSFEILHLLPHSLLLSFTVVNYLLKFLSPPTLSPFFSMFLYVSLRFIFIFCSLSFPVKSPPTRTRPQQWHLSFLSAFWKPFIILLTSFNSTFLSSIGIGFPQIDCIHFLLYFSWKNNKMEDHFAPEFLVVLLETHLQSSTHNRLYKLWQSNK